MSGPPSIARGSPAGTELLQASAVEFGHGRSIFLRVQDLRVAAGSFVGILGPNGAGKSTLLRILAGLHRPFQGVVYICGHRVENLSSAERARLLAWVPQRAETPFEWTVREMVALGRHPYLGTALRDRREDVAAVEASLRQVGLEGLAERPVGTLSGGEWQRAVIARALAQEPRVLLLDEPVANLDLGYQRQIYEMVHSLCRDRGMAVLAADHHVDLQARYCDAVVLLDRGEVRAQGRVEEVLTRERLEAVFRTPLRIGSDPATRRPTVTWAFDRRRDSCTTDPEGPQP
jgi:iron complex transport system ATP-binding protein